MSREPSGYRWTFACTHIDHPDVMYDLSEFAEGAPETKVGQGAYHWDGGFRGRPGLLEDLMPTIRAKYSIATPRVFSCIKSALRTFYRFLDSYERVLQRKGAVYRTVENLHHVTGSHVDMMTKPGPDGEWVAATGDKASTLRTLILDAAYAHELPEIFVPALARNRGKPRDTPTQEEGTALIRFLRSEVLTIFERWKRADNLAAAGRNILATPRSMDERWPVDFNPTEADAHATYRALIAHTGHPLPTPTMLREALGIKSAKTKKLPWSWWPHYAEDNPICKRRKGELITFTDLAAGLYPTTADVLLFALLCLGRSAWNPSTLFSIDIRNWHSQYDDRAVWVFAPKVRAGGGYQYTVARVSQRTGVFLVVAALIERSAPLRSWLASNRNAHPTPSIALRSPWLGMSDRNNLLLFTVDPTNTKPLNDHLRLAIGRHNESRGAKVQIRHMTGADFRDVAAVWVYKNSRYSTWVTMLLLGHKRPSTTRDYLATRAARQESHGLVKSVMDDVFLQIDSTRHWNPTLTRAKIEGIETSAEAKERLDAYRRQRTYDGSICTDPLHPPRYIDPGHPHDGKKPCIQGHRCVAARCPKAMVFTESLPWLARRTAELEWTEQRLGTVRFSTSTDAEDLAELRKTLEQWPKSEVDSALADWRIRLENGTHKPMRLAGRH